MSKSMLRELSAKLDEVLRRLIIEELNADMQLELEASTYTEAHLKSKITKAQLEADDLLKQNEILIGALEEIISADKLEIVHHPLVFRTKVYSIAQRALDKIR